MRLPDFLLIGATKCGTTTLYQYLQRHPQIFMSTPKEPEFFASENDANFAKGIDWYASLYREAEPHQLCGEASTRYTHWPHLPHTASRIADLLPDVKLIYIMRHPVERAYSHYVQRIKNTQLLKRQFEVRETFEENIERDSLCLDASNYIQQIEQYTQYFPREAFLFLLFDDLKRDVTETLGKICQFIGVDNEIDLIQNDHIHANRTQYYMHWFLRARTTAPLRAIPGVARAAALLPQGVRDWVYEALLYPSRLRKRAEEAYIPKPMQPKTRVMLLDRFREPNAKLAEYLRRDLSHWEQ